MLFGLATSACLSCHKVGGNGGTVGPELTKVGLCLKPDEIVESVLWPNRTVKPEFKAIAVTMASGKIIQGILRQETTAEIVLVDSAGKRHHISKKDIDERRDIGSLMPEGLTAALSVERRRDLIRYLLELGRTFATPSIRVKAGEPIRLTFKNPDVVPHNWVLVKPGTLQIVGKLTNQMLADPEAVAKHYVPQSKDVLLYTDIVSARQRTTIYFRAPTSKGRYPFLCTFPGHWMVMNGEMLVED